MSFAAQSVAYLRDEYLARLRRAVEVLDPSDTWWRPHGEVLSIGNILLHLKGNVRQWILAGVGGEPDERDRGSEFAACEGEDATALFSRLEATVLAACDVIKGLDEERLMRRYDIQGYDKTGFGVVYHVVEHFSWHVGQAVWIAKARGGPGHGIAFFDDAELNRPPE